MSFWALMFCDGEECNRANDSIHIFIESLVNYQGMSLNYQNIGQQKVWRKFSFLFEVSIQSFDVSHYNFLFFSFY